jgi:hypothetical protein
MEANMATQKELELWLGALHDTVNFKWAAHAVFNRLAHAQGNSMIVLQGPTEIGNKSYFLKMVKAFQRGVPEMAKLFFPEDMQRLVSELDSIRYQCVDIEEEFPKASREPLHTLLPFAMASALRKRGLRKGQQVLILCDNLNDFMQHNESDVSFLKEWADRNPKDITFLGAYTLQHSISGKLENGLENAIGYSSTHALGYD